VHRGKVYRRNSRTGERRVASIGKSCDRHSRDMYLKEVAPLRWLSVGAQAMLIALKYGSGKLKDSNLFATMAMAMEIPVLTVMHMGQTPESHCPAWDNRLKERGALTLPQQL